MKENKSIILLLIIAAFFVYYLIQHENVKKIYDQMLNGKKIRISSLKEKTLSELIKRDNMFINLNQRNIDDHHKELIKYGKLSSILDQYGYSVDNLEDCEAEEVNFDIKSKIECPDIDYNSPLYDIITDECSIQYQEYTDGPIDYLDDISGQIKCHNKILNSLLNDFCEARGSSIECINPYSYPPNPVKTLDAQIRNEITTQLSLNTPPENYYKGYKCSNDCTGHKAGYAWAKQHNINIKIQCTGNSQSFIQGCLAFAEGKWKFKPQVGEKYSEHS